MAKSFFAKLAGIDDDEEVRERPSPMHNPPPKEPQREHEEPMSKREVKETGKEDGEWLSANDEGQLALDVYQKPECIIIKSTIAGSRPEDIDIAITNDMVTIRGKRHQEETISKEDYFYQECYWGSFSRSVVLPVEVNADESEAKIKNGILTIVLPKAKKNRSISVKVRED